MISLDTTSDRQLGSPSEHRQTASSYFLSILSVIDRTMLPRLISISNGAATLKLVVAERKALPVIADGLGYRKLNASAADAVESVASLCRQAAPVTYGIQSIKAELGMGYTISELVNAQQTDQQHRERSRLLHTRSPRFAFDATEWPVQMPERANAQALISAWRTTAWLRQWLSRAETALGKDVLLVTTSPSRNRECAIHSSADGINLQSVNSEELGRLLSGWRARPVRDA